MKRERDRKRGGWGVRVKRSNSIGGNKGVLGNEERWEEKIERQRREKRGGSQQERKRHHRRSEDREEK